MGLWCLFGLVVVFASILTWLTAPSSGDPWCP